MFFDLTDLVSPVFTSNTLDISVLFIRKPLHTKYKFFIPVFLSVIQQKSLRTVNLHSESNTFYNCQNLQYET